MTDCLICIYRCQEGRLRVLRRVDRRRRNLWRLWVPSVNNDGQRRSDDECYRCDHRRDQHHGGQCDGIWSGRPCPCESFDEADHWKAPGQ